jgi:hypothetical protein
VQAGIPSGCEVNTEFDGEARHITYPLMKGEDEEE